MIRYIELKSGFQNDGPAWIAKVERSRSGKLVYFNNRGLQRANVSNGNFIDIESGDVYWISGVKTKGSNRIYSHADILIEEQALESLNNKKSEMKLSPSKLTVISDLPRTDKDRIRRFLNKKIQSK